ncbi:MAG: putative manganese transporter [Rhodospirillales bacterium]|nr:putative manganese transporter [Rhodospirillales bacterium]
MNWSILGNIIVDSLKDSIMLFPFLLVTYILLEYWEHKNSGKSLDLIGKSGRLGAVIGGICGIIPQCGFAAAAANFYAARAISVGTLVAVFLTTSDEMLPIMISNAVEPIIIFKILGIKLILGVMIGMLCDAIWVQKNDTVNVEPLCEDADCHCAGEGILRPALFHAVKIMLFVLLVTLVLNTIMAVWGEQCLSELVLNRPVVGVIVSGLVGLVPNCSASVIITQLWLSGAMNFGAMLAGLLAGAGAGLLVLFKVNKNKKENFKIIAILYFSAVIAGILVNILQINL